MGDLIIISVNPKAGKRSPIKQAEELQRHLREKGFDVHLLTDLTEISQKARQFHQEKRLRALVGCGGDGTAATLVNLTEPGTPVTLLASGTANLLAKEFRLPHHPKKLAEMIANGTTLTLDAGRVVFHKDGQMTERLFLVMVSCGFDADVVSGVHHHREQRFQLGHKRGAHISYFSYIKPILKSLFTYRFQTMNVEKFNAETSEWEAADSKSRWAFFFNINRYGWGLPLAPFAKHADGLLDSVLFRGGTVFHGILYTSAAQCFSVHRFLPSATLNQATRFRVTANDGLVPFQMDGDFGGTLPLEIEVIPNRLTFLVPSTNQHG